MLKHKYIFYLFCFLFAISCNREEIDTTNVEVIPTPPTKTVSIGVFGKVKNQDNQQISGVIITANGAQMATTNGNGVFTMKSVKVNENGYLLVAKSPGYLSSMQFLQSNLNDVANVEFALQELPSPQVVASASTVFINEYLTLEIPAQSLRDANGQTYSGDLKLWTNVYTSNNLHDSPIPFFMPALDAVNNVESLQNQIGIYFDIQSAAGEPLTINPENPLQLLVNDKAPWLHKAINFYKVEEQNNVWKSAYLTQNHDNTTTFNIKNTGVYQLGQVSKASQIKGKWALNTNLPMVGFTWQVWNTKGNLLHEQVLSQSGVFHYNGSQEETYTLKLLNSCGAIIKEVSVSPNTNAIDLGLLSVSAQTKRVFGSIQLCNGLPSTAADNIMVELIANGQSYISTKVAGDFEFNIPDCEGLSRINFYEGDIFSYSVKLSNYPSGVSEINLFQNVLCLEELAAKYGVDGATVTVPGQDLYIGADPEGSNDIQVFTDGAVATILLADVTNVGKYTPTLVSLFSPHILECENNCNNVSVEVLSFGQKGDMFYLEIEGEIDGQKISGFFKNYKFK